MSYPWEPVHRLPDGKWVACVDLRKKGEVRRFLFWHRFCRHARYGYMALMFLFVLFFVIATTACGGSSVEEGYIKQKKHTPAHWEGGYEYYDVPEFSCGFDSDGDGDSDCGVRMVRKSRWERKHEYIEDKWEFQLEDCETKDQKTRCKKGWIEVDEQTFNDYKRNHHYPDPR